MPAYNKAAGAEARERNLRTYVLGHYKSQRADNGMAARAVPLRDHNSYSVLLSVFHNEGFDQTVTLAQAFWLKDPRGQLERFLWWPAVSSGSPSTLPDSAPTPPN